MVLRGFWILLIGEQLIERLFLRRRLRKHQIEAVHPRRVRRFAGIDAASRETMNMPGQAHQREHRRARCPDSCPAPSSRPRLAAPATNPPAAKDAMNRMTMPRRREEAPGQRRYFHSFLVLPRV